jgi:hypothetical protein
MQGERIRHLEEENKRLKGEVDNLRNINFEYVKQLNEMAVDKQAKIEKIIITPQFFENSNIDSSVKDFLRKLSNNFRLLEKEQKKLIDHCKTMESDINN